MRNLISEFYHSDKSLFRFVKDKGLRSNYIAIQRHWKGSMLQELKDKSVPLTHALPVFDRFIQADKERLAKRNKERASVLKKLPEEFEAFMLCLITEMATCGKGLGRRTVKSLVEGCLREYKLSDTKTAFSQKTFERFLKEYDCTCKNVKNINPERALQVKPENREIMFANLDSLVGLVNAIDKQNCPWTCWEEVPARNKYNVDEMSTDPTSHRNKIVLPKWLHMGLMQITPQGNIHDIVILCTLLKI